MRRSYGRWVNQKMSQAFLAWVETAAMIRAEVEERRRRQMAMRNAILKFQNRLLTMGWNTWRASYLEALRQMKMMAGAIRRMIFVTITYFLGHTPVRYSKPACLSTRHTARYMPRRLACPLRAVA